MPKYGSWFRLQCWWLMDGDDTVLHGTWDSGLMMLGVLGAWWFRCNQLHIIHLQWRIDHSRVDILEKMDSFNFTLCAKARLHGLLSDFQHA